eukprot:Sspe_Gene.18636::Locus_6722_Transcript_1_1_Confidence_1.000_Length_2842::g.18636::m.18636
MLSFNGEVARDEEEMASRGEDELEASLGDLVFSTSVPLTFCLQHVGNKVRRSTLISEMLVYIPFLIMFMVFVMQGRSITEDYYVGRVLRDRVMGNEIPYMGGEGARVNREVKKTFEDIAFVDDWYDWVSGVLVPNLWDCQIRSPVQFPTQQGLNYLLGAIRFRTLRAGRASCSPESQIFQRKGEPVPPVCPNPPEEELWVPPVFNAIGTPKSCWRVAAADGARISMEQPNGQNEGRLVAVLPEGTEVHVAEQGNLYVRLAGPVAGWSRITNSSTAQPILQSYNCTVNCINCLGSFGSSTEETSMRYNVTNPLVSANTRHLEENKLYRWKSCSETSGGTYIIGDADVYHCGGYVVDIPFNIACTQVQNIVSVMRGDKAMGSNEPSAPFADSIQSRFVSAEYFTYTPHSDTFHSVKLFIEILPSGAVLPQFQFRAFKMWTEARFLGSTIYDFFFFVFVLYYLLKFFLDWRATAVKTGRKLAFFLGDGGVWALLEFANIVTLITVMGLRWAWWDVSKKTDGSQFPLRPTYPPDLDRLKDLYMSQIYANSFNTVLSFLKILKYCQLSDKLNILTITMGKSKDKIVGVLLLFAWIVLAFAITGHTLFGGAMWGFRNLNAAYSTLLRMLLGDFDYEALRKENRFLAGVYFWSYCVLALFLLLNFIIAIICEAFSEATGEVSAVPFHVSVQRFLKSMQRTLNPINLVNLCKLTLKRQSRSQLLEQAFVNMENHRLFLEHETRGEDLDSTELGMVQREKLRTFFGQEQYEMLGEKYMDDLWKEIVEDYEHEVSHNPEEMAKRETTELLEAGINAALQPRISDIQGMPASMAELEESVEDIIHTIIAKQRGKRK